MFFFPSCLLIFDIIASVNGPSSTSTENDGASAGSLAGTAANTSSEQSPEGATAATTAPATAAFTTPPVSRQVQPGNPPAQALTTVSQGPLPPGYEFKDFLC